MRHSTIRSLLHAAACSAALATPAMADELHVPADYATIQAAVGAADDGDTVVVAPGTYREAIDMLGKEITLRSSGGPAVTTLDGAGLGTCILLCDRGETLDTVVEGFTIRAGEGAALPNCSTNPASGGAVYARLSSLTLRGCDFIANGVDAGLSAGGAVCVLNGGLRVERCTFVGNGGYTNDPDLGVTRGGAIYVCNPHTTHPVEIVDSAFTGNRADSRGASIWADLDGPLTVTGSSFMGNVSDYGAGVDAVSQDAVVIADCTFIGNESGYGPGVNLSVSADVTLPRATISRCEFEGNSASFGGGMNIDTDSQVRVEDCRFSGNEAAFGGGLALWVRHARIGLPAPSVEVDRCVFEGNAGGFGGGLVAQVHMNPLQPVETPRLRVSNSQFAGNTANGCCEAGLYSDQCVRDGSNNGVYYGGGADLRTYYGGEVELVNCEVVGNDAIAAGGLHLASCGGGEIRMVNCTVADNATSGVHARLNEDRTLQEPASLDVHNSISWGNGKGGGENLIAELDEHPEITMLVTYSDVGGGASGEGNIDADPLFEDAGAGDYSLGAGSPSIDAADNTRVPGGVVLDAAGDPRFVDDGNTADTGVPGGEGGDRVVDMGAYEFQGEGCRADVNGDGVLDTRDFIAFLNAWSAREPLADWNGDGVIDSRDVIAYLGAWAAGC